MLENNNIIELDLNKFLTEDALAIHVICNFPRMPRGLSDVTSSNIAMNVWDRALKLNLIDANKSLDKDSSLFFP